MWEMAAIDSHSLTGLDRLYLPCPVSIKTCHTYHLGTGFAGVQYSRPIPVPWRKPGPNPAGQYRTIRYSVMVEQTLYLVGSTYRTIRYYRKSITRYKI